MKVPMHTNVYQKFLIYVHTSIYTYIHLMFMLDFRIGTKLSNFVDTPNNKKIYLVIDVNYAFSKGLSLS